MPTIHGTLNVGDFIISDDYEHLRNLPQINDVLVIGNKSLATYGIQPTNDYATTTDILELFANP